VEFLKALRDKTDFRKFAEAMGEALPHHDENGLDCVQRRHVIALIANVLSIVRDVFNERDGGRFSPEIEQAISREFARILDGRFDAFLERFGEAGLLANEKKLFEIWNEDLAAASLAELAQGSPRFAALVEGADLPALTAYVVANAPASEVLAKGLHELALEYLFSLDEERLAS